jgi:hypothetical protein
MVDLTPDCSQCAALCCLSLAFDKSALFGFDKAAGEPCKHLNKSAGCSIHSDLDKQGFGGCIQYQCDGAGQRVVQEVFNGESWQNTASLSAPMMEAFRAMRLVHKHLALVSAAGNLGLSEKQRSELADLTAALSPSEGWTQESLARFERGELPKKCGVFFKSLQDVAKSETNKAKAKKQVTRE